MWKKTGCFRIHRKQVYMNKICLTNHKKINMAFFAKQNATFNTRLARYMHITQFFFTHALWSAWYQRLVSKFLKLEQYFWTISCLLMSVVCIGRFFGCIIQKAGRVTPHLDHSISQFTPCYRLQNPYHWKRFFSFIVLVKVRLYVNHDNTNFFSVNLIY